MAFGDENGEKIPQSEYTRSEREGPMRNTSSWVDSIQMGVDNEYTNGTHLAIGTVCTYRQRRNVERPKPIERKDSVQHQSVYENSVK